MNRTKVTIVILTLLASFGAQSQEKGTERRPPDQYGRYVITFSPFARADSFLLDTQTGKVWQLTRFSDLEGEPLMFKNLDGSIATANLANG